jgi:hypothetical protein
VSHLHHIGHVHSSGLSDGEWAAIASAAFTALTALAALASVFRIERDRWRQAAPEMHLEILADAVNNEMRMTIANLAAPARDVRIMGTLGGFGWFYPTPPTTYWTSGETRTYRLRMPLIHGEEAQAFVEARDIGKRRLVIATIGGKAYRWSVRKAEKLSPAEEWRRLYPDNPPPTDVQHPQVAIELVERHR